MDALIHVRSVDPAIDAFVQRAGAPEPRPRQGAPLVDLNPGDLSRWLDGGGILAPLHRRLRTLDLLLQLPVRAVSGEVSVPAEADLSGLPR